MLSFSKTKNRIKNLLKKLANQKDDKLVYENNLTHQEIAAIVGSTRETVTRLLNELEREGYFIKKKNKIILKKNKLWQLLHLIKVYDVIIRP